MLFLCFIDTLRRWFLMIDYLLLKLFFYFWTAIIDCIIYIHSENINKQCRKATFLWTPTMLTL